MPNQVDLNFKNVGQTTCRLSMVSSIQNWPPWWRWIILDGLGLETPFQPNNSTNLFLLFLGASVTVWSKVCLKITATLTTGVWIPPGADSNVRMFVSSRTFSGFLKLFQFPLTSLNWLLRYMWKNVSGVKHHYSIQLPSIIFFKFAFKNTKILFGIH